MRLEESIKEDLQFFVYSLFHGSLSNNLYLSDKGYLKKLLMNKQALFGCFKAFAFDYQKNGFDKNYSKVVEWIESFIKSKPFQPNENVKLNSVLAGFLQASECFCFNSFPRKMKNEYIVELEGVGGDAVQVFSVWTNVIELKEGEVTNLNYAINRMNDRIKLWEGEKPAKEFLDWEIDQMVW